MAGNHAKEVAICCHSQGFRAAIGDMIKRTIFMFYHEVFLKLHSDNDTGSGLPPNVKVA